jgi:tetratricopeptide (TPR) repeat protein
MLGYAERLQGADRLPRIRRVRNAMFAAILALTGILIVARLSADRASLKPFFLPVNGLIEVGLFMGLVTAFVGLYLRLLEIRNVRRDSQRYLMAKSSMARASRTAGLAIGFAIILLAITPALLQSIASAPPRVISLEAWGVQTVSFDSPDPLGVSFVTHAVIILTQGDAGVSVLRDNEVVVPWQMLEGPDPVTLNIEPTMWAGYATWSLVFQNPSDNASRVQLVLEKAVVSTFFSTVPSLLFLYGAAQIPWWVVLRPVRERTKANSLVGAASALESGERVFDATTIIRNPAGTSRRDTLAFDFAVGPPRPVPGPPPTKDRSVTTAGPTRVVPPPIPKPAAAGPKVKAPTPTPRPSPPKPETPHGLVRRARAHVEVGAYEAGLAVYEEALRLDPSHMPSLEGQADCLLRLERGREALNLYRRILARDPTHVGAWRAIARIHEDERRWRECLEALDQVLRLRPNDFAALELKGDALTNLGRRPEALASYEAAVAVNPADDSLRQKIEEVRVDIPGLLSRALIASANGNYPQALALFDEILGVDEANVNALIGKAVAYRRSGKPQEALNCLDLVLGIQPNNASALLNRGNLLLEAGNLGRAFEAFDRLTQLYPSDESAWAAKGYVLVKMGREEDALRAFSRALELSPGDDDLRQQIQELEGPKSPPSDVFDALVVIKGVGKARARALVDAGFRTREAFAKASVKDLMAVRGITRPMAEELRRHFRSAAYEPEQVLK